MDNRNGRAGADNNQLANSELIIGLACAVGTDIALVIELLSNRLKELGYETELIKISKLLIEPTIPGGISKELSSYARVNKLMDQGNELRKRFEPGPYSILASGVAHCINQIRQKYSKENNQEDETQIQISKTAFIIDSLKHPDEVEKLREIYPSGFYMFVVNESEEGRARHLMDVKNMGKADATELIHRDMEESTPYGQHTRAVFELADFHLSANVHSSDGNKSNQRESALKPQIDRILNLIFGHPFITPTFDEYAMFMAYSSGLRSADLSRQVGAVIAKNNDIIATGANDVPCFGGGQYWPDEEYKDFPQGRDYTRGFDSNKIELKKIVDEIIDIYTYGETPQEEEDFKIKSRKAVLSSSLKELTEYGRPVHAEMAAIMSCSRNSISTQDATLYCSTFPCHNCAKHIISSGIKKVVYIEPYPKSRTLDLYNDSITINGEADKVSFSEFVGIGPRRFYDLFSLRLSTGARIRRKGENGYCVKWSEENARVRCQMISTSYIDKEAMEALKWENNLEGRGQTK
ncbi:MAG: dCMP deaminase family protein [Lachnospiraceae bacterium]|jgi:deoxycytidylate deaminase|nr:dCMP deaminase family protein [Lachnospiraceae bacterium]